MARPPKPPPERATRHIRFRVTETEYQAGLRAAADLEHSPGTFARDLYLAAIATYLPKEEAAPEPDVSASPGRYDSYTAALRHLAENLRSAGQVLNGAARAFNASGEIDGARLQDSRQALLSVLPAVMQTAREVPDAPEDLKAVVDALVHQVQRIVNNVDQLIPALFAAHYPGIESWYEIKTLALSAQESAGRIAEPAGFRK